ncbi:type II toxin-antitoxin system RelE/ParE family toxin [Haematobacter genomosp. 1]|uniref:Type II toxin-antitoxin system mRNA interferase toxin, RelE/StbE family n=1 Tax=Haematobacter genomosp. 1 TaxID=366618 RepID=A0A212AAE8_9RHOB|nr:type II toxin-antitoxin system RelE/ParE family toxin [Haematobacter genomosp. 1]OWJ77133.1 type II toxin-antitoxin system mRNA interferase toxin, RelE/StbE family [Haematobacter genomosp. 1]
MPDIVWRQVARRDLRAIFDYITEDSPSAALALLDEIEAKVGRLRDHPRAYRPGRVGGTREMVVRPNYLLVYSEAEGTVTILRVLHAAQMWP